MNRIAVLPEVFQEILSTPKGFDLDHDGQREFIFRTGSVVANGPKPIHIYECTGDDVFVLAHVLDLAESNNDSYIPTDVGDSDSDGFSDLIIRLAEGGVLYGTRVYESISPRTFPTELAWEVVTEINETSWGCLIADTDLDGRQEIVVKEPAPGHRLVIYENDGDDSYVQSWSVEPIPGPINTFQSFQILNDLDGDGRDEILVAGVGRIVAFESSGDDAYEHIWTWTFSPAISPTSLIDAGDLDGDGKKEFLAGGLKGNAPLQFHFHVFELVADNEVEIVFTYILPTGAGSPSAANVADVDGDGRKEIVVSSGAVVKILQNTGDNAWQEIWSGSGNEIRAIGAGDHDQDGKDEIIFRTGSLTNGSTSVWEIDPAFQADLDGDDRVDAIDNCPLDFNPGQEDADADSIGDACDNCLHGPNPNQGPAPFGQTILAVDGATFSWPAAADVLYIRGDLAEIGTYAFDLMDGMILAEALTDGTLPESGAGFWYLLRPDCTVGSWQSELGAEPARDAALP